MDDNTQIVSLLEQILVWMRFQNRQYLKALLSEVLTTDTDRRIYDLSDGRSQPDIAKQTGVSQPTVSGKWKSWRTLGIVYDLPEQPGRCRHLASRRSLGLDQD